MISTLLLTALLYAPTHVESAKPTPRVHVEPKKKHSKRKHVKKVVNTHMTDKCTGC